MRVRPVYNLEFPSWCPELNISGYQFKRVSQYQEQVLQLQHLSNHISEYIQEPNTGTHAITGFVEVPDKEEMPVLEWAGNENTALMDVLLLLTLFTGRDVFVLGLQRKNEIRVTDDVIIADPRVFKWGGILRASLPYEKKVDAETMPYNIGFEKGLNQIISLIRSDEWHLEYKQGYFLFLANMAFRNRILDAAFIQCWTIWEHLFAISNERWLSQEQIHRISSVEKISYLLVKFAFVGEIDNKSRKKIRKLVDIRNRLVHFGKYPETNTKYEDATLFIRLTEFIVAKALGLAPSEIFNTMEKLEAFLENTQSRSNS